MPRAHTEYAQLLRESDWEWKVPVKVLKAAFQLCERGAVSALRMRSVAQGQVRITGAVKSPRAKVQDQVLVFLSRDSKSGGILISPNCTCRHPSPCEHAVAVTQTFMKMCQEEMEARRRLQEAGELPGRKKRKRSGAKRAQETLYLACLLVPETGSGEVALEILTSSRPVINGPDFVRWHWKHWEDPSMEASLGQRWMQGLLGKLRELAPSAGAPDEVVRIQPDAKGWADLLADLMKWQILYWGGGPNPLLLHHGEAREAAPEWRFDNDRQGFFTDWKVEGGVTTVIPAQPVHYVDVRTRVLGSLATDFPQDLTAQWMGAGRQPSREQVSAWNQTLVSKGHRARFPLPPSHEEFDGREMTPQVRLHLRQKELPRSTMRGFWSPVFHSQPVAEVVFGYGEHAVSELGSEFALNDERIRVRRNERAERDAIARLDQLGLSRFIHSLPQDVDGTEWERCRWVDTWAADESREAWMAILTGQVPALQNEGWEIVYEESFEMRFVEPDRWVQSLKEKRNRSWFEFELGIECQGQRIDLIPVLVTYLEHHEDFERKLESLEVDDSIPIPLDDGRFLAFPVSRLGPIVRILKDILEGHRAKRREDEGYELHQVVAADFLVETSVHTEAGKAAAALEAVGRRLQEASAETKEAVPQGLQATLRTYQEEGFQWLQFLSRYGVGGILADDMGLGKTLQTIAHLLAEKESGRLSKPALVVTPTSLLGNWQDELKKFAPALGVHLFYGTHRHSERQAFDAADVIITSYSLVYRDQAFLETHCFSHLILDEAQNIKNPASRSARAVCALDAEHRLCLSGTPMENHLEELWSLFHFLMPGFLGRLESFRQRFRYPIEREQDETAKELLASRVGPLMLRRKKTEVAKELPRKTEILRTVELEGAQRDLYETIRASMEQRVQEVIAEQGIERAHLYILDALLKLRQVCCHPQLLDLEAAQAVTGSAKMELLFEWLPTMLEEGRRILVFSQFTSMLGLIEKRLLKEGLPFLKLTGQTRDRAELVRRFQKGEVPLFLISLKAGGVGLNLTKADTVIHYDPWWNPAVESQATDRAYRIGQDNPVFVYKLVTKGSIEERIVAMQEDKRELVESLLTAGAKNALRFGENDLQRLFQPLAT